MKVNDWLKQAQQKLDQADIGTSRLDALVLLEDVMEVDRSWLLAHIDAEISSPKLNKLKKLLNSRINHLPLAYVRGKTEFFGREFLVRPSVLVPRPESEAMIELLKALHEANLLPKHGSAGTLIADVGTGCGALGITAALEVPKSRLELLEISKKAAEVAKMNVDKFTLNISITNSDLLSHSTASFDVLLCNLPYVPDGFKINQAATYEPEIAIFGGPDGLDIYRKLFKQLRLLHTKPLYILTESLPSQQGKLQQIAAQTGYDCVDKKDFILVFRYVETE